MRRQTETGKETGWRARDEDEQDDEDEAGLLAVSGRPFPGVRYMVRMGKRDTWAQKLSWAGQEGLQMAMLRCYDARVEGCPCSVLNLACPDATKFRPTRLL